MSLRVDSARNSALSVRDDMMLDIVDVLKLIKKNDSLNLPNGTTYTFKSTPVTIALWRIDALDKSDLPGYVVFDSESEEEDNTSRVQHKLNISVKYVASAADETSSALKAGIMDALQAIYSIEQRMISKYHMVRCLRMLSTQIGVEKEGSTNGAMEVVIEVVYTTGRFLL